MITWRMHLGSGLYGSVEDVYEGGKGQAGCTTRCIEVSGKCE